MGLCCCAEQQATGGLLCAALWLQVPMSCATEAVGIMSPVQFYWQIVHSLGHRAVAMFQSRCAPHPKSVSDPPDSCQGAGAGGCAC